MELVFKLLFLALWLAYILIRAPFDKKYKQQKTIIALHRRKEKFLLVMMGIGSFLIPLIWAFTPFLDRFSMGIPVWIRVVGVLVAIFSLFYFRRIHKELDINWSPTLEIRKDHQLIKTGPYKKIRHPMYAQIWLWIFAQFFIVSNFVAGFSGLLVWALLYFVRIPEEEKMMKENFGREYENYIKETGRVIPKV
jgi:protein-S-isoprenylcysteine O-methyltransferase Ste14